MGQEFDRCTDDQLHDADDIFCYTTDAQVNYILRDGVKPRVKLRQGSGQGHTVR